MSGYQPPREAVTDVPAHVKACIKGRTRPAGQSGEDVVILQVGDLVRRPRRDTPWKVTNTSSLLGLVCIEPLNPADKSFVWVEPQNVTFICHDGPEDVAS